MAKLWKRAQNGKGLIAYECQSDITVTTAALTANDYLGDTGLKLKSGSGVCKTETYNGILCNVFFATSDSIVRWPDALNKAATGWKRYIDSGSGSISLIETDLINANEVPVANGEILVLSSANKKYNLRCTTATFYVIDENGHYIVDEENNAMIGV